MRLLYTDRTVSRLTVLIIVIVCAVCGLLFAEWRGSRAGVWVAKPVASLGFLALAWLGAPLASTYGSALALGLVLCALGDVLLIPSSNGRAFLAGIGSFALGHLAYALGFGTRGLALAPTCGALAGMLALVWSSLRWLGPHLPAQMRVPVRVYMGFIACMVATAVGCSAATGDWRVALGAVAFALSDLSVARERFLQPDFANLLWGLPLYYAAQCLLALTSAA